MYPDKIAELSKQLIEHKLDAMLIGPSSDLEYIAGLHFHPDERFIGLFVLADQRSFYIIPELYYEEARERLGETAEILVWSDAEGFLSAIRKAQCNYHMNSSHIGVNDGIRAVDMLDIQKSASWHFQNSGSIMERMRLIKSESERKSLRKAAEVADYVMGKAIEYIKPGLLERDISNRITELFLEAGDYELAFSSIVASGPNTSRPHYSRADRKIEEQDVIILDFGCRYEGYCSDISRTVFVGEPTKEQREVFDIVQQANTMAENAAKPGITAGEVDEAARSVIREAGYGQCFINRTGHGIGVAVHEGPYIKSGNTQVLEAGMAFSIEPGIYIAGKYGMRIEDIVLVTENGREVLNKFTKDIIILKP